MEESRVVSCNADKQVEQQHGGKESVLDDNDEAMEVGQVSDRNGNDDVEEGEVVEIEDGEIVDESDSLPESNAQQPHFSILDSPDDENNVPACNYFRRRDANRNVGVRRGNQNAIRASNADDNWKVSKPFANRSADVEFDCKQANSSFVQETSRRRSPVNSRHEYVRSLRGNDADAYDDISRRRTTTTTTTTSPNNRNSRAFRSPVERPDQLVDDAYATNSYRSREPRNNNWERRDRWNREGRGQRERSRPLPYTRTLQDSMEWKDPWQRTTSPGWRKRGIATDDDKAKTKRRHRYSRSLSSSQSSSSSSSSRYRRRHGRTLSRSWDYRRNRQRSISRSRRMSGQSLSSIGSAEVNRRSSPARRSSCDSFETREKDSHENPRDYVRTIFARKKNKKSSASLESSTSASNSASYLSEAVGELTTEDEVMGDVEEKDNDELLDIEKLNREDLEKQLKIIEAAIRKRRAKQQQLRNLAAGDA